jgi:flagellar motor switch protein FliN
MSEKKSYLDCWIQAATSLLAQALLGEPTLSDSLPKPMPPGSFGFAVTLGGEEEGRFSVMLDGTLTESSLFGEGADQKAGWAELLREVAEAAVGELLASAGHHCRVTEFIPIASESKMSRAFQLKAGERSWYLQVFNGVKPAKAAKPAASALPESAPLQPERPSTASSPASPRPGTAEPAYAAGASDHALPGRLSPGLELLLDVELEAALRFGSREMPLGEILDLGPGDVVQLDRHINDPVDLIVGDKIVARGDVVLVNGNFGLRVTEVAEPQRRLESIRCLF